MIDEKVQKNQQRPRIVAIALRDSGADFVDLSMPRYIRPDSEMNAKRQMTLAQVDEGIMLRYRSRLGKMRTYLIPWSGIQYVDFSEE